MASVPSGALMGGLLGAAIGVRETLILVTIASMAGLLWLIGTPILRLREIPAPASDY